MATTPYIQIVASGAAKVYFDLIGNSPHVVDDQPLGPSGAIVFTMDDWSDGMLSIEEGLQYRQGMRKYVSSTGGDAAFPGQVIVQSVASTLSVGSGATQIGNVIKQLDFVPSGGTINTYIVANNSGNIMRLVNPGTTNNWTIVNNPGSNLADLVVHGSFIAAAYDTGYDRSPNGTVWTASTLDADAFGTLNQNIYRADENTVYGSTALDGSWDAGTVIGDNNSDINSLLALEQILMVGKSDGIYTVDAEGTSVQMTPELRTQRNANIASVGGVATFNGDYYFRTLNGMIQINGADGQKRRVGFDQLVSPDIPAPATKSMTWDDRYLYAISESSNVTIFRRSVSGAWHVYWQGSGLTAANHVGISAVFGFPTLFFSYGSPAISKYIRLSTFPNPLQDTNYRYYTDNAVRIRMPRIGSSAAQMLIDRLDIQSRNLETYKVTELFTDTSNITVVAGTAPSVAANVLTAGAANQEQQYTIGSTAYSDNRFTGAVKLTTDATNAFIDVGKFGSASNYVVAELAGGATDSFSITKVIAGTPTSVASVAFAPTLNQWYWIELESQGTLYIARLYSTGSTSPGTTKANSTLQATISGTITDSAVSSGKLMLRVNSNFTTAAQWGGIAASPGGAYVGRVVSITPYYSADGGTITQFGSVAVTTSPSSTVTPSTAITCNYLDLYFEIVTDSPLTTPVLSGFTLHGVWRPGMRRTHQFTAAAAAYHGNNRGGAVKQSPVTTIANLQALRTQGTYAVVTDENGQSFSGVVTEVKRTMTKLVPPNTEPEHAIQFTVFEKAS